jgi:hypothetical protein
VRLLGYAHATETAGPALPAATIGLILLAAGGYSQQQRAPLMQKCSVSAGSESVYLRTHCTALDLVCWEQKAQTCLRLKHVMEESNLAWWTRLLLKLNCSIVVAVK